MCVYVYVYTYIYIYTHVYIYIYIYNSVLSAALCLAAVAARSGP